MEHADPLLYLYSIIRNDPEAGLDDQDSGYKTILIASKEDKSGFTDELLSLMEKYFDVANVTLSCDFMIEFGGSKTNLIKKLEKIGFGSSEDFDKRVGGLSGKTCPEYKALVSKESLLGQVSSGERPSAPKTKI